VTAQEFKDYMQQLKGKVTAMLQQPKYRDLWIERTGGTPEQCPPIYSFDNPPIHTDLEVLKQLGLADEQGKPVDRLVLPAHSPDLHRCAERVHARICGKFQEWLNHETEDFSMEYYCRVLQNIYYTTESEDITYKDIANIDKLYDVVIELNGARAPRPFC
jgi:hypothetical protein